METMAERRNRQYAEALAAKKAREAAGISDTAETPPVQPTKAASAEPAPSDSSWGLVGKAARGLKKYKGELERMVKESEE